MRYYTEEEFKFESHERDVRSQIDDLRNMADELRNAIKDMIDNYCDLIEEGTELGIPEEEIMEDYAGYVNIYDELRVYMNENDLGI